LPAPLPGSLRDKPDKDALPAPTDCSPEGERVPME